MEDDVDDENENGLVLKEKKNVIIFELYNIGEQIIRFKLYS